jgi:predicted acyl esterase
MDKSPYEAQALTWTSVVLARPAEITGFPRLVLWASVSRPDADFIAELTDVAPGRGGGWTSTQITRGYLRAQAQFSRTGPTDLAPGDVYRFDIELQPTSYVVPAGHRVRFTVQGAAIDPAIDVSWHGPGLGRHQFSVVVHTGPDGASFARRPLIRAAPAPSNPPAPNRSACVRYDPREGVMTGGAIRPRVGLKNEESAEGGYLLRPLSPWM